MKNRIAYLVINNKTNESSLYTDKRKVKVLLKTYNCLEIYMFKSTKSTSFGRRVSDSWDEESIYKLNYDGIENKIEMFNDNGRTYSDLGCFIMESIAKAEWHSSIKYPDNGWNICSTCGRITNEIGKCLYCEDFVCWECANEAVNLSWEDGSGQYCSYDCYRKYLEQEYDIEYNPEREYKEKIINRLDNILKYLEQEQLFNIILKIKLNKYNEQELENIAIKYKNMSEDKLLNILNHEDENEVCDILLELYENETDERLSDLLDAEAFINNLNPNDPADAWFFED